MMPFLTHFAVGVGTPSTLQGKVTSSPFKALIFLIPSSVIVGGSKTYYHERTLNKPHISYAHNICTFVSRVSDN